MGGGGQSRPGTESVILLDTHVLVWLLFDDRRIGRRTRQAIDRAWAAQEVAVSAVTFWEVALLHEKRRLTLLRDIASWRQTLFQDGLAEIAVDGEIGIQAASLKDMHADPADRLIVATALAGHQLVTADQHILDWSGPLDRLDATA